MTHVQVCICTFNRRHWLEQTLQSLRVLQIPPSCRWEVLIVDNNSQDDTPQLIQNWQPHLPIIPLHEKSPGHVAARNCAVRNSTGELLLWTDDDVLVSTDWLANYVTAARESSDYDFWGGRITPKFPAGCPAWITENWSMVQGCFAARDLGTNFVEFAPDRLPYGANMAVRGEVQRQHLFPAGLGRAGHKVVGQDEIQWMQNLIAVGHRGHWIGKGGVEHLIGAERTSPDYIFRYFLGQGNLLPARGKAWSKSRRWLQTTYRWHWWRYERTRDRAPSGRWLAHLIRAALALGQAEALQ
jgi:glycosyltransferase involved in cell wall biosynthesis